MFLSSVLTVAEVAKTFGCDRRESESLGDFRYVSPHLS